MVSILYAVLRYAVLRYAVQILHSTSSTDNLNGLHRPLHLHVLRRPARLAPPLMSGLTLRSLPEDHMLHADETRVAQADGAHALTMNRGHGLPSRSLSRLRHCVSEGGLS